MVEYQVHSLKMIYGNMILILKNGFKLNIKEFQIYSESLLYGMELNI